MSSGQETARTWIRRLVRVCLISWPRETRESDAEALTQAVEDTSREASGGFGLAVTVSVELTAIVFAGLRMRGAAGHYRLRQATFSWWGDLRFAVRRLARSPVSRPTTA